jgi:hypothetical protein
MTDGSHLLDRQAEIYDPSLITAAGYPPPLAGVGAASWPAAA